MLQLLLLQLHCKTTVVWSSNVRCGYPKLLLACFSHIWTMIWSSNSHWVCPAFLLGCCWHSAELRLVSNIRWFCPTLILGRFSLHLNRIDKFLTFVGSLLVSRTSNRIFHQPTAVVGFFCFVHHLESMLPVLGICQLTWGLNIVKRTKNIFCGLAILWEI